MGRASAFQAARASQRDLAPAFQLFGQQRLQPLAHQPGQRRRRPAGGERDGHRPAADHRRRVGRGRRGIVDRVHEQPARLGRGLHLPVHLGRRRRHHEPGALEIRRRRTAAAARRPRQRAQLGQHLGRHHRAPARPPSRSDRALPSATGPPPTSNTLRPASFRKAGNSGSDAVGGRGHGRGGLSFRRGKRPLFRRKATTAKRRAAVRNVQQRPAPVRRPTRTVSPDRGAGSVFRRGRSRR